MLTLLLQVADVFDEMIECFWDICTERKWGIIISLIRMAQNKNETLIVKKLRRYFSCNSASTRSAFVRSIFTLDGTRVQCRFLRFFNEKDVLTCLSSAVERI